jgi:hypothetical protein
MGRFIGDISNLASAKQVARAGASMQDSHLACHSTHRQAVRDSGIPIDNLFV